MAAGFLNLDRVSGMMKGEFCTLSMTLSLILEPNGKERVPGSNAPTHDVYGSMGGKMTIVGSAWTKTVQKEGPTKGMTFYTLTIDDPDMGKELHLTAFQKRDEKGAFVPGAFNLIWERPSRQTAAAA